MKIFIYKTIIITVFTFFLFQFTIGQTLKNYENRIENILYDKSGRKEVLNKIRKEIKSANQKKNIFTDEDKKLLSNFINKIRKELSTANTQ